MSTKFDPKIYLLQVGLKSLGFPPGDCDGEDGPETQGAFQRFQAARQEALGASGDKSAVSIAERLLQAAMTQEGVRESEGKNRGPGIRKFWGATSYGFEAYDNREPYCAAFVCWAVQQGIGDTIVPFKRPDSAKAYDLDAWAAANGKKGIKTGISPASAKPGDLFTLATASHCGIIVAVKGGMLHTIEGNTDGSGSREGDGVYQRTRSFASIRNIHRIA